MRILQVYSGQNTATGDFIYRIAMPQRGLARLEGIEIESIDLLDITDYVLLLEPSLLILHHVTDPDLLPVVSQRRQVGLPTIYELADNFRFSGTEDGGAIIEALLRRCDAVQTTGRALEEAYGNLNPAFHLFPNLVTQVNPLSERQSEILTVGWGGSARHVDDLMQVREALISWVASHPEVRLAIMASHRIQSLFRGKLAPSQLLLKAPGSLSDYYAFLQILDIGLAPLQPTPFNTCRSDVKYLEYACHSVVPVCSDCGPYPEIGGHGERILLFQDEGDLVGLLEQLRSNPGQRRRVAENAMHWVKENRLENPEHWRARLRVYQDLARKEVCSQTMSVNLVDNCAGDELSKGIAMSDPRKSAACLEDLFARYPDHGQTGYFYAWALCRLGLYAKAVDVLCFVLTLRPDSIRAAQLLIQAAILNDEPELARQILVKAMRVEPDLPVFDELRRQLNRLEELRENKIHFESLS